MIPLIASAAIVAVSLVLIVALAARRSWFQRHARYWEFAWGIGLAAAFVILVMGVAGIFVPFYAGVVGPVHWALDLLAITLLVFVTLQRPAVHVPAKRRILAVGAHPDDLELAAGGSIARFADRGHEVRAMIMSDGSVGGDAAERPLEAVRGGRYLGMRDLTLHRYTDTRLGLEMDQMIGSIEAAIAEFNPDIILTHSANDQHQDHHAVHMAVLRAGRRVPTILCFESPSVTSEFDPRFFVDVNEYVHTKVAAVRRHADQAGKPYMGAERIVGQAIHRGSGAKVQYAEGFEVVRALSASLGDL